MQWASMGRTSHGAATQLQRADSVTAAENGTMPRAMNDPHVDALVFRVEHGPSVSYAADAPPIEHQELGFRVRLTDGTARFELDEHYATQEEALEKIGPYVRNWEMDACLRGRPDDFRLKFQRAEVIDRDPPPPTPGTVDISLAATAGRPTARMSASVERPSYPLPPSGLTLKAGDPDVETMYRRLSDYYSDRERLPSMAYLCLTVIEDKFPRPKRRNAARSLHIDLEVLDAVGDLSSTKGGEESARKAMATGTQLSSTEKRFLEEAVKQIIRRAAEAAQNPGAALPPITLASLGARS